MPTTASTTYIDDDTATLETLKALQLSTTQTIELPIDGNPEKTGKRHHQSNSNEEIKKQGKHHGHQKPLPNRHAGPSHPTTEHTLQDGVPAQFSTTTPAK
jgi:hypothetical protein